MFYSISTDSEYLTINLSKDVEDNDTYEIRIVDLPEIRYQDGTNYSEWIMQIYDCLWAGQEMLYSLAKHIIDFHPDNKINWLETFKVVEYHEYGNSIIPDSGLQTPADFFSHIHELIDNPANPEEIHNRVFEKLKKFGILTN